jgi:hypothetical protein
MKLQEEEEGCRSPCRQPSFGEAASPPGLQPFRLNFPTGRALPCLPGDPDVTRGAAESPIRPIARPSLRLVEWPPCNSNIHAYSIACLQLVSLAGLHSCR